MGIYVEKDEQLETIEQLLQNNDSLLRILSPIDPNTLHAAINIDNLKRIQQVMSQNLSNDQETAFWQPFFEKNAWVLSLLFTGSTRLFHPGQARKNRSGAGRTGMGDYPPQFQPECF